MRKELGGRRRSRRRRLVSRVEEAVGAAADAQLLQRPVVEVELRFGQRVGDVAQLVRIDAHVVVGDEAGDELAVERVVRGVQRPHAPVPDPEKPIQMS